VPTIFDWRSSAIVRTFVAWSEKPKLSVEKALEKLRRADAPKSKSARHAEEVEALMTR
jgi:hypothetical protein